jgi:hypothetical protein
MNNIDHMTLEELEAEVWPEPDFNSHLVMTCHRLRKKRLSDFSIEDLRIMLGQSIGAKYLAPKAVGILQDNPFAEGDFFKGDLMLAVARHPENTADLDPEYAQRLLTACLDVINSSDPELKPKHVRSIEQLIVRLEGKLRL